MERLESNLTERGLGGVEIEALKKRAGEDMEYSSKEGAFDRIIKNDDLEASVKALEAFIYGTEDTQVLANGTGDPASGESTEKEADVTMEDIPNGATVNQQEPQSATAEC